MVDLREFNSALPPLHVRGPRFTLILLIMNFTNFTRTPKTPTHGRSRSTARTPLSPSLANGLNALNISHTSPTLNRKGVAACDITNPFIVNSCKSRSSSPVKRVTGGTGLQVNAQLKRQASSGVIKKGAPESRMDVITLDYNAPRPEAKRSKSQSSLKVSSIPCRLSERNVDSQSAREIVRS